MGVSVLDFQIRRAALLLPFTAQMQVTPGTCAESEKIFFSADFHHFIRC
jgi:hypothetical protein